MNIFSWLDSIGFNQYAELFEENGIDLEIVGELTNDDLKDLGITRLGDRKKILLAAGNLASTDPVAAKVEESTATAVAKPSAALSSATQVASDTGKGGSDRKSHSDAENRLLTVMFCDLVGSTELSTRVDAEELRDIINRFQTTCSRVVEEFGGFVARFMGDGILVYYGYPTAREDDAERAVLCALHLVREMPAIEGRLRVGIASGRVVVGDLLGKGPAEERTVVGETPNLAARLQSMAAENSVVISSTTKALAGNAFEFRHLGEHDLKGFSDPIDAWQVLGEISGSSRYDSRSNKAQSNLIGRDSELLLLMTRWRAAMDSEGQAVFVSGEAGIGKSRLTDALRTEVAKNERLAIEYQCSTHHSGSALYPVIRQVQYAAGITQTDTADEQLDKLEALLDLTPGEPLADERALFARLLSIDYENRYGALQQPPDQIKANTIEALIDQLLRLSTAKPVLFMIEDAHWIDPTTLALLDNTIQRMDDARILIIVTHRPEWQPSYSGVTTLQLSRLGKANSAELIRNIIGEFASDSLLQKLVARADGIPLFIEELSKSLVEHALESDDDNIPETLQASLLARIDRLDPSAREIAQLAASIGREFDRALLIEASGSDKSEIESNLQHLLQAELIVNTGSVAEYRYLFKHALIQEAVYSTMLRQVRRERHGSIANALALHHSDAAGSESEILARHYNEAGEVSKAVECWQSAGLHYASLSSNLEAVQQFKQAIAALDNIPESDEVDRQKLQLSIAMTGPLVASAGFTGEQTAAHVAAALELALKTGETKEIFPILYGRYIPHCLGGKVDKACELADEFVDLATREQVLRLQQCGLRMKGQSYLLAGKTSIALQAVQNCTTLNTAEEEPLAPYVFGQDIETASMLYLSLTTGYMGHCNEALSTMAETIVRCEILNHPNTTGFTLIHAALLYVWFGLDTKVNETVSSWKKLDAEHQVPVWRPFYLLVDISQQCRTGQYEEAIDTYQRIKTDYMEKTKLRAFMQEPYARAAEAYMKLGRPDEASDVIDAATKHAKDTGEYFFYPEVLRIQANLLVANNADTTEVLEAYDRAMQTSESMESGLLSLRIAVDKAKYQRQQRSNTSESSAQLATCIDSLNCSETLPDYVLAKELLAQLQI